MFSAIDLPVPFTTTDSSSIHTAGLYAQATALHSNLLTQLDPLSSSFQLSQSSSSLDYGHYADIANVPGGISRRNMYPDSINAPMLVQNQAIFNPYHNAGWLFNSGVETVSIQLDTQLLLQPAADPTAYTFSMENSTTSTVL